MNNSLDNSSDQQGFGKPKQVSSFLTPQVLNKILKKLTGLVTLTEAEREEAGIFLGDYQDRKDIIEK